MSTISDIRKYYDQGKLTILTHRKAIAFTIKHKLWVGFWNYGWVSRALLIISVLAGLKFLGVFWEWLNKAQADSAGAVVQSMGILMHDFAVEGYELLFFGSMKYVVMALVEVIIFHVSRRTLEIIANKKGDTTFDTFLKAQIRMLNVILRAWIFEIIITKLIQIVFGIFGILDFLEPVLIFGVQCYFLGFIVMDNYIEQFGLTVKESFKYGLDYIGVSLAIGVVLHFILMIPFLGALAGPFLAAVTVTLVMYKISDLHILGREAVEGINEIV